MAKYAGNDLTFHLGTGSPTVTYALVGGASAHTYTLTNSNVDTTDKDSSRWGESLPFGRRQISFSFNGFVSDNTQFAGVVTAAEADTNILSKIFYGGNKVVTATFHIDSFEITGESEGAQTFSISLTSSGTPTFGTVT